MERAEHVRFRGGGWISVVDGVYKHGDAKRIGE